MASISDLMSDELTGHSVDLMRVEAATAKKILGQLKALEHELVQKIGSIDTESVSGSYKLGRLEKLKDQTSASIKNFYSKNKKILNDDLVELSQIEEKYSRNALNKAFKVELASTAVPLQTLKQLARGSLIEGSPAAEWWSRQAAGLRQKFNDQMTLGVLQGETNGQLVQRLRGTATGKFITYEIDGVKKKYREFVGGLMDIPSHQAKALVRTSVQNVANLARMETYKANSDVISKIQTLASLDNRTTPICIARSGLVWELATGNPVGHDEPFPGPPPWHYNCRSTFVPITKTFQELAEESGKKLKKKVGEIPPSTQASMDGQVSQSLNYESWLKTKPKSFQKQVLGNEKYKMFTKGELKLKDLIDHQTGRPLSLAELRMKIEGPSDTIEKVVKEMASLKPFDIKGESLLDRKNKLLKHKPTNKMSKYMSEEAFPGASRKEFRGKLKAVLESKDREDLFNFFKSMESAESQGLLDWNLLLENLDDYLLEALNEVAIAWGSSSTGSVQSLILQLAVRKEMGLSSSIVSHLESSLEYKKAVRVLEDKSISKGASLFVRAVYNNTQDLLKANGINEVYAYRGATYTKTPTYLQNKANKKGGVERQPTIRVEASTQPLNSWTTDFGIAIDFAESTENAASASIFASKIPATRIFSTSADTLGEGWQSELVILGGVDEVTAVVYDPKKFSFYEKGSGANEEAIFKLLDKGDD